ncbi:MAG: MBL fold metallo-hydrolase [Bacteroidetes bacterium]|nr:MBL fold metallo-hydrolase [Bacteroidota bacterium]
MKITLYGAAGGVTGSLFYVKTQNAGVVIDCGLFQGNKKADLMNRKLPPISLKRLDAIVLTHAHLDHCGRLPLFIKYGYDHPVYATPATIEMVGLILHDAVRVQASDIEHLNRRRLRKGKEPTKPLYDIEDVERTLQLLQPIPYNRPVEVAPGILVQATEAGHILGSASLKVIAEEDGRKKVAVFSGDIGPHDMAILKDAVPFHNADVVFMESTYGDRDHRSLEDTILEAEDIIRQAIQERGKILVPAFAVGRTQQLLYYLAAAFHDNAIPRFPVYLDSPMAIEATKIYARHHELWDKESMELIRKGYLRADLSDVISTSTPEESKALNEVRGPCLIMAGSGMCNAGRILHHLRHNLWRPETSVIIVGYQAEGTLGRRLVDGARTVSIFGEKIAVRATIHKLGGFSAHAGQTDLLHWFDAVASTRPLTVLIHGETRGREPLAEIIRHRYGLQPLLPEPGDVIEI